MTEKSAIAFEDMEFGPLGEGSPVQAALLWGNPETGPAAVMVRFPAGFKEPFHSHSTTYHAVMIKGEFQSHSPDQSEEPPKLGPGAYLVQPGGEVHAEANAGDEEMVAMVFFDGPIDFVLAE